jgi:SNF2 family DNA or RNA helicase
MTIIINETFSDDAPILDRLSHNKFESNSLTALRLEAEEISHSAQITELLCYPEVRKSLEFDLSHQPEGALRILRDFNGTALLADEVGLGKTIIAGIILKEGIERGLIKRALILTPPSLVSQWIAEAQQKFNLALVPIEHEHQWPQVDLAIASIDRVKVFDKAGGEFRHRGAHEINWDLLIVDEAHKLKDSTSRRWQFVNRMQKKRFLILTATPFQNDLLELYNLLHLLKRGHLGTLKEFKKEFFHKGNKRHPLNPRELRRKLNEVMIRRRRDETGIVYKKRVPQMIAIELSKKEQELYEATCDLLKTHYFSADGNPITGRLVIYALLPKVTSSSRSAMESLAGIASNEKYHAETRSRANMLLEEYKSLGTDSKITALISLISRIQQEDPGSQILIYTKHPITLRYIVEKLHGSGLSIIEYAGGLTREEREERVKAFKAGANIMISTETGAEGLNFQFCHHLINYDLPWNPMSVEQRIGRLDRIGQKHEVNVYSFATKGTMEERVVDLIINKMCCVGLVIGELPIILFNLGLDSSNENGLPKIEELIMDAFIDSKNNLDIFSQELDKLNAYIQKGILEYHKARSVSSELLDGASNGISTI